MDNYSIYKTIAKLSQPNNGYTKELNVISWNNREPVYDIRTWDAEHTKYGKGVTLSVNQLIELKQLLDKMSLADISSMMYGYGIDEPHN
ncbi:YdbC family protein [Listeria seeligeri]|uniref:YdbC family protein n=1 Tax=Listeria seeligeri TaxID=1640 RepID=UPI0022EBEC6A|nr:PC4/YdbC family ssDNA-binding protein [Listeria seeligeri]